MTPHTEETGAVPVPSIRARMIEAVPASAIVKDNVWQWIYDVAASSPVQPTVNLGTSFIDHSPPSFLIEAHKDALDRVDSNQYAAVSGSHRLKQALAELYSPLYDRQLNPDTEICISSGAQEGLLSCVMSFIQPGDEVILLEPVFTMYEYQVKLAGGTIRYVPIRPPKNESTANGTDWTIDMAELEGVINERTKMIYLNNPHNPLGKVFTRAELTAIGNLCVTYGLVLVSDEVYERIVFPAHSASDTDAVHTRVASISPEIFAHTLTVVSLAKLFNATGWRVGFVIGCEVLMRPVIATHLVLAYSSSGPAQEACAVGLRETERLDWWTINARDVGARIRTLCSMLDDIGLSYAMPSAAWFIFVLVDNISVPADYNYPPLVAKHGTRDWKTCFFLVQEFGIASIPGSCFYGEDNKALGAKYLRFGACKSDEGLQLASERLQQLKPYIKRGISRCGYN